MSEQDQTQDQQDQTDSPPTGTPPVTGGESSGDAKFSQEQVDAILAERLRREREKYTDYDELKAKASKWAEYEDAQKSELEKAQERADALERAAEAQQDKYRADLIRMEARVQAAQMGFKNPDDAFALADLGAVEVADDGAMTGVQEALKALAKSKPYLLGDPPKPPPPGTDGEEGNRSERGEPLTPAEQAAVQAARASGYKIDEEAVRKRKQQAANRHS